jgi:hypothetical protein
MNTQDEKPMFANDKKKGNQLILIHILGLGA